MDNIVNMDTNKEFTCDDCGEGFVGFPPPHYPHGSAEDEGGEICYRCNARFSIREIANYLEGWSIAPAIFTNATQGVSNATLQNALTQLRDDQDGIYEVTLRDKQRERGDN